MEWEGCHFENRRLALRVVVCTILTLRVVVWGFIVLSIIIKQCMHQIRLLYILCMLTKHTLQCFQLHIKPTLARN